LYTVGATHTVSEGIKNVRRMLGGGELPSLLHIHPRCTALIREFQSYRYADTQAVTGEQRPMKQDDHCCFSAGTLITTRRGQVAIEQVTTEDEVLTRRGYQLVTDSAQTGIRQTITVLINGRVQLTGTPEHPIWTEARGFVRLDELTEEDAILTSDEITAPVRVQHITVTRNAKPEPVFNLTVHAAGEYFASGVLVHNCDALRYACWHLRYG
jgi:hypothetical protein